MREYINFKTFNEIKQRVKRNGYKHSFILVWIPKFPLHSSRGAPTPTYQSGDIFLFMLDVQLIRMVKISFT